MMKQFIYQNNFKISLLFLCFFTINATAQQASGTVTDGATGESLIGASILVKGTDRGTITDLDGNFMIDNVPTGTTLQISYTGYLDKEVTSGQNKSYTMETNSETLDEVVVTGVFNERSRMAASVAISTLGEKELENLVPNNSVDLLRNIPGVFVNSSRGEVNGKIYTRGLSIGRGYFYVSMQEDGLPIMALSGSSTTDPMFAPDGFLRADANIKRVEAVRGGSASILGANAPGGIFNYISRTGGSEFKGEARVRLGLEGNGQNPFYRTDLNVGGPLSKDKSLTYNIGGFYRYANGHKSPGYPMSRGGQLKGNILKTYNKGSLKLYAKVLNDNVGQFEFTPTTSFDSPAPTRPFTNASSVLGGANSYTAQGAILGLDHDVDVNTENLIKFKDNSVGLKWNHDLGNGWSLENNGRVSKKSSLQNSYAVVFPFSVDNITFYGVTGNVQQGRFGNYEFYNVNNGSSYGSVDFRFKGGPGFPFEFGNNNLSLPGNGVKGNALLYTPTNYTEVAYDEFIDQFSIKKKLDNMTFTAGIYYAKANLTREGSFAGSIAQSFATIEEEPQLVGIRYTNGDGEVFDFTNPDGVGNIGNSGIGTNEVSSNQFAFFLGHDWQINSQLSLDWGIRYENFNISNTYTTAQVVTLNDPNGGIDGNPNTLYDNRQYTLSPENSFTKDLATFSYSAGLNYQFNNNLAVYGRFSQGRKSPDLSYFMDWANQAVTAELDAEAQDIKMLEAGIKVRNEKLNLFITPFYNTIDNIPNYQVFQDETRAYYAPDRVYQKIKTYGVELEANYAVTNNFSVRGVATFQDAEAVEFPIWLIGAGERADDAVINYDGNKLSNVPPFMLTIAPTYSDGKVYASLNYQYMGKRWANTANAFELPAYSTIDLNLGYNVSDNFRLSASINNVLNNFGVLSWAAPGGFPASLDTEGFTIEKFDSDPNAIYSTLSVLPRSYYLTATLKF